MRKINPDWTDPEIQKDEDYYYIPEAAALIVVGVLFATIIIVGIWMILNWR